MSTMELALIKSSQVNYIYIYIDDNRLVRCCCYFCCAYRMWEEKRKRANRRERKMCSHSCSHTPLHRELNWRWSNTKYAMNMASTSFILCIWQVHTPADRHTMAYNANAMLRWLQRRTLSTVKERSVHLLRAPSRLSNSRTNDDTHANDIVAVNYPVNWCRYQCRLSSGTS